MRRMSRLLWFESLNISSWDLIKLQSQVLFKTFPIFNAHIQRTTSHEYLWQAGQNTTIYISKVNALYMHILRVFRLVRLIQNWGLGFPQIGLWGCHKDCFEGWVWIIGLDCGVPIKTNQGSGVTFGTCLLQRSLALYPESPICIYNIISQLSWRQKLILSQKQVFSWSCKIRWEMSEKVQQKTQGCKIWRRKHIMMSKSTFRKILGPSPSCWRGAAN